MTETPQAILDLVERFSSNVGTYPPLTCAKTLRLRTPMAKELLQRQIDATDRQIDRLVYELYGLTEEEIGIVEESPE